MASTSVLDTDSDFSGQLIESSFIVPSDAESIESTSSTDSSIKGELFLKTGETVGRYETFQQAEPQKEEADTGNISSEEIGQVIKSKGRFLTISHTVIMVYKNVFKSCQ